jgi:hypothetical protein
VGPKDHLVGPKDHLVGPKDHPAGPKDHPAGPKDRLVVLAGRLARNLGVATHSIYAVATPFPRAYKVRLTYRDCLKVAVDLE